MADVDQSESLRSRPAWRALVSLARPHQWAKSIFVLIGPFYGFSSIEGDPSRSLLAAFGAAAAFALASSACYVFNDIFDAEADRAHPRKCRRPIPAGEITVRGASVYAACLLVVAAALTLTVPPDQRRLLLAMAMGLYVLNVALYSTLLKHIMIADVMSLSIGFVLRVLGGCAAVAVVPSGWLLNCTFFLSMFLAFGKRLGERRTMGDRAGDARAVQDLYTDELLRMSVVVTGVATLLGYMVWVEEQSQVYLTGFNLLWLTVLPATYCLFRTILLVERGVYDDPTEMAVHDRAFQLGALIFIALTAALMWHFRFEGGASVG